MLESKLERDFTKYVKSRGGVCLKQNANWYRNIPDRLVVCPGGWCYFLELKRLGEKRRKGQRFFAKLLRRQRIPVEWADNIEDAILIYEAYSQ